ncbi:unnamed protein product, partial [Ascophyllum nodosum]
ASRADSSCIARNAAASAAALTFAWCCCQASRVTASARTTKPPSAIRLS